MDCRLHVSFGKPGFIHSLIEILSTDFTQAPRAVLVHINFRNPRYNEELQEFVRLTESSGLVPSGTITGNRARPDAKFFIGSGKVEEIRLCAGENSADVVIFNHGLSPAQERNLESAINCRVLDRVGLILDIFSQRARTYEGKLQVELAQLQHLSTRLVRGWSHLERQKGGIGLRGPGETQLETDRRLIGNRIKTIRGRLEKVKSRREQGRRLRRHNNVAVISLVGYTNAGKSTLFNRLTGADVYCADKLFATLDPTIRKARLTDGRPVLFTDTVGFIRHLPHDLVESFHATLDEVRGADLLLHVIDINDNHQLRIEEVNQVIEELGATSIPQILVFNKIDKAGFQTGNGHLKPNAGDGFNGGSARAWVSALGGAGLRELKQLICRELESRTAVPAPHIPLWYTSHRI